MNLWLVVLLSAVFGFVAKIAGYLVPSSVVEGPRRSRVIALLPIALLSGLLLTQTVGGDDGLVLDARVPAVLLAIVLFTLRVNFLVVVITAAALAAVLRALGWAA